MNGRNAWNPQFELTHVCQELFFRRGNELIEGIEHPEYFLEYNCNEEVRVDHV